MYSNNRIHTYSLISRIALNGALMMLLTLLFSLSLDRSTVKADADGHSHFRFAQITWEKKDGDPPNSVRITYVAGFRRNGFVCSDPLTGNTVACNSADGLPGVGDVVRETIGGTQINDFGDGTFTPVLYFKVFSVNVQDNWLMTRALQPGSANQEYISHTYPGTGPYTIVSASCCRTGALAAPNAHINNPDKAYRFESVVNFQTKASPISLLPPIVDCPRQSICSFSVAAVDPDQGDPQVPVLTWRLATPAEMGGTDLIQPPAATINRNTGVYTWDTRGVTLGPSGYNTLYSTQVVVEDGASKVVLDFFLRIVDLPGPPDDLIMIPTRWCALNGSPTVENPTQGGASTVDLVLNNRIRALSSEIYTPEAHIAFISGLPAGGHYPIINGPRADGHINTSSAGLDVDLIVHACRMAWRDAYPAVTGMIAVNIDRFVNNNGDPVNDYWGMSTIQTRRADVGAQILRGYATIIDNAYFVDNHLITPTGPTPVDRRQKWLAHELGHGLSLRHPGDETFTIQNGGVNLMQNQNTDAIQIENEQRQTIRTQASLIPDIQRTQARASGGTRPDQIGDTPSGQAFIDLNTSALAVDNNLAATYLSTSTVGLFPSNITGLAYYFAIDSDNNPITGGSPSAIGVPGNSQGIELIGRVQVNVTNGTAQATPTLWKYQTNQFVQVTDPSIQAVVDTSSNVAGSPYQTVDTSIPTSQLIELIFSNNVRGPIAAQVRLLTVAQNTITGSVDSDEGSIFLTPATLPSCQVDPAGALLGSTTRVTATNLPASSSVDIYLGTQQIASSSTDASGNMIMDVSIPTGSTTGTDLVSVQVTGSATAATCPLQLWAVPVFDNPPSPTSGSSFIVNAGQTLSFTIQASDPDVGAGDTVLLGIINLPSGATFPIPAPTNPASATFSWTPTVDQIGSYVVVFTAKDSFGFSPTPLSITITVQPPPAACVPSNTYGRSKNGGAKFASLIPSNLTDFTNLPLSFVPNRGQEDGAVRFQVAGMGGKLFFTPGEVVFSLPNPVSGSKDDQEFQSDPYPANVVRIHYEGANNNPEVVGIAQLPGRVNVLMGNDPSKWLTNLPTYSEIAYRELYPGIELHYEGTHGKLKSTFYVTPGANPSSIIWRYSGAQNTSIDKSGNLMITLSKLMGNGSVLIEQAPIAWQEVNGHRAMVKVQYVLDKKEQKVSFLFPNGYDYSVPLLIDPVISYSTYLGGGKTEQADAVTLDADCNLYLTGTTLSQDFPTVNTIQPKRSNSDIFVSKLNPTGDTLLYSTYIGGGAADHAWGIKLDSQGRITLVGETESSDFPKKNAYDTSYAGGACENGDPCDDVFVTQLLPDGSGLRYSTYMGGSSDDEATAVAVGPDDKIYVTGWTKSSSFPKVHAYDSTFGGGTCSGFPCRDAFVARIDPALTGTASLLYSTFLGGNNYDKAMSIALDANGYVYITGYTNSSNYPTLNPYQAAHAGSSDIFVTKLNTTLSGSASLLYSTYFGSTGADLGYGIALNGADQVYLTGWTESANLPLANAFDNSFGGGTCGTSPCNDAFVIHLDIANNLLIYSSYLGGSNEDQGAGIAVDDLGNAYVTGYTKSADFQTVAAIQAVKGADSCGTPPCADAFVVKVSPTGNALIYSTYLGGSADDYGNAVVVDGLGSAYIVGHTFSSNFPTTPGSFPFAGASGFADAFVVKIDD